MAKTLLVLCIGIAVGLLVGIYAIPHDTDSPTASSTESPSTINNRGDAEPQTPPDNVPPEEAPSNDATANTPADQPADASTPPRSMAPHEQAFLDSYYADYRLITAEGTGTAAQFLNASRRLFTPIRPERLESIEPRPVAIVPVRSQAEAESAMASSEAVVHLSLAPGHYDIMLPGHVIELHLTGPNMDEVFVEFEIDDRESAPVGIWLQGLTFLYVDAFVRQSYYLSAQRCRILDSIGLSGMDSMPYAVRAESTVFVSNTEYRLSLLDVNPMGSIAAYDCVFQDYSLVIGWSDHTIEGEYLLQSCTFENALPFNVAPDDDAVYPVDVRGCHIEGNPTFFALDKVQAFLAAFPSIPTDTHRPRLTAEYWESRFQQMPGLDATRLVAMRNMYRGGLSFAVVSCQEPTGSDPPFRTFIGFELNGLMEVLETDRGPFDIRAREPDREDLSPDARYVSDLIMRLYGEQDDIISIGPLRMRAAEDNEYPEEPAGPFIYRVGFLNGEWRLYDQVTLEVVEPPQLGD